MNDGIASLREDPLPESRSHAAASESRPMYRETCGKCGGSGRWTSFSGFSGGTCFACKGVGYREFATPSAERARARQQSFVRKERQQNEAVSTFRAEYPDVYAWIAANNDRDQFAASLNASLGKYGSLTENQIAAVRRSIVRASERAATRAQEQAEKVAAAPVATADRLAEAFAAARAKGAKYPRIRLAGFVFTSASETSRNPGAVYAKDGHGTYLGKAMSGKFLASRECDAELAKRIADAVSDPQAAAIAYGKEYGSCAICGRELSDPESVERGIGPICAAKFGW